MHERYSYDALNQLVGYTSPNGDVYAYTYKNGNILTVTKNGAVEKTYGYNDANWPDKLTSFNGNSINYSDNTGNPSHYYDYKFLNWSRGRQLSLVGTSTDTYYYTYDANGNRVSKKKNSEVIAEFHMVDGVILEQTVGSDTLSYYYDESGRKLGFRLNDSADYYYEYNLQGDVIGIFDSTGTKIVTYTYDPWGKLLSTEGSAAETIGLMNPIRYRGYYYDTETGFYYLQTRYYDPEVGRFINSDTPEILAASPMAMTDKNLFAYCDNNPVMRSDHSGEFWLTVAKAAIGAVVNVATSYVAAKITGQEYTWEDVAVDALSGVVNAIPVVGLLLSAGITGVSSARTCYRNGATIGEAILGGTVAAVCTTATIGNLATFQGTTLELAAEATVDLVFGMGNNAISAATTRSITEIARIRNEKQSTNVVPEGVAATQRGNVYSVRGLTL